MDIDRRMLLIGDFASVSGFSTVNEALAPRWRAAGWEIAVLALNYTGEPHPLQHDYRLYPAYLAGDTYGIGRIAGVVQRERPDLIVAVNDPQIVAAYLARLAPPDRRRLVAYVPVDGIALQPDDVTPLGDAGAIVAYTQFGAEQLQAAGLNTVAAIIPHAVDPSRFFPVDRREARARIGAPEDAFLVLMADRNTRRKALDIGLQAFAQFAEGRPDSVQLFYHGAIVDEGPRLDHLAPVFGIGDRFRFNRQIRLGKTAVPADDLRYLYSAADVFLSSTTGEGWGLTAHEALACGVPCVLPDFAAYGEWVTGGALLVPGIGWRARHYNSTLGMEPSIPGLADALSRLYEDTALRAQLAAEALPTARRFAWDDSAAQFLAVFDRVLAGEYAPMVEVADVVV